MAVFFDVTTMLAWQRPVTGILRVEMECARNFLTDSHLNVRFCRYAADLQGFVEVDREALSASIARLSGQARRPASSTMLHRRMASTLRGIIRRLPDACQTGLLEAGKQVLTLSMRSIRALRSTLPDFLGGVPAQASNPLFGKGDVYISLGFDWDDKDFELLSKLRQSLGFRVLLCCHDIIPVVRPDLTLPRITRKFEIYLKQLVSVADHIVCFSENTQRDLLEYMATTGSRPPGMSGTRYGSNLQRATDSVISRELSDLSSRPFILYVSTIEKRKNHQVLYEAYVQLIESGRPLPLLFFVGMQGWGVDELMARIGQDRAAKPYIHILNNVSDHELHHLYDQALFTVYPSHYEGCGLPVAEALTHGKFCLASRAASIPEVGGELLEYLDPADVKGWAARIAYYYDNPNVVHMRESQIRSAYQCPLWGNTARHILEIAQSMESSGAH